MKSKRSERRSPAETMWLSLLLHIGFSKPMLSEFVIRKDQNSFGKRAVCKVAEDITVPFAFSTYGWPSRPSRRFPSDAIKSYKNLLEVSLFASTLYYLYGESVYEELGIGDLLHAYDLYTNIRKTACYIDQQITPDTAYWIGQELLCNKANIPFCATCDIRYFSSSDQSVRNVCPFCKKQSAEDFNSKKFN